MVDLGESVRAWMQRDRQRFRAESQDLGWGPWLLVQALVWTFVLTLLAVLAAVGQPMWSVIAGLISATGGLGLARAYHRHRRRPPEVPFPPLPPRE